MASVADLVMIGVSHQSLPLADLERIVVRAHSLAEIAERLGPAHRETVVLSTCSRTEIYATSASSSTAQLIDLITAGDSAIPLHAIEQHVGEAALRHLFRVTAGLESRIAGEVDILRQVRAAAREAEAQHTAGVTLQPVFAGAVATARRIHRETGLGAMGRSLGRSAIDDTLADRLDPTEVRVAVVGAGKMAAAALDRLRECGVRPTVFERRRDSAAALGVADRDVRPVDELLGALH